jgi:hypothetical protein
VDSVRPVHRGTRRVLVVELWRGPERRCAHRCLNPVGACDYAGDVGGDADDELLPEVTFDEDDDEREERGCT